MLEKKDTARYDVIYYEHRADVELHFCREWDDDGGCYGTNPNHGFTWDEARKEVADYYFELSEAWRKKQESEHA